MSPPEAPSAADPPPKRPWWTYAIPYPGPYPRLGKKQWSVLGLLGAAELFDHYDIAVLGLALSQIQAGLGIAEEDVGALTATIRLGALPALALMVLADRIGRRRLLLVTIVGFTLCTFATAFVRDAAQFAAMQFLARVFVGAETMLAVVVVAEELRARDRGFGIGLLGAMGALGFGVAAIVFGFVDVLPYGWRAIYAIGIGPLLLLAWFRRNLTETERFEAHRRERRDGGGLRAAVAPIQNLLRMYPRRVFALVAAVLPFEAVAVTAITFNAKILQEVHGYTPGQVTTLFLVAGGLGITGNIIGGQLGDRYGRRRILIAGILIQAAAILGFYNGSGWWLPPIWIALIFSLQASGVLFKALGSELFPTSYRSTASGVRAALGTLGAVIGLSLEGPLYERLGSHELAISALVPLLIVPPLVVALFLPETAQRELEDVSPERA